MSYKHYCINHIRDMLPPPKDHPEGKHLCEHVYLHEENVLFTK
jgi:hypothetical protein